MVLAYTEEQGPESDPYLVPIHAAPIFSSEPIDPIPQWLHQLLIGQLAIFHMLVNAAKKLDDWSVAADITCYWEYNDEMANINAHIEQLQAEADSVHLAKLLCEGQLKAARVLRSKGLKVQRAQVVLRRKWSQGAGTLNDVGSALKSLPKTDVLE